MRHRKSYRKLNRTTSHRRALLSNMAASLLIHEQITTTVAKAKNLRPFAERLITLGKRGDLHARRLAMARLYSPQAVQALFGVLAARYRERPGGFTRIVACGHRRGDQAPMAVIELVDRDPLAKGRDDRARRAQESPDEDGKS